MDCGTRESRWGVRAGANGSRSRVGASASCPAAPALGKRGEFGSGAEKGRGPSARQPARGRPPD